MQNPSRVLRHSVLFLGVALLAVGACAPAATAGPGGSSSELSRDEIMNVGVNNLYDVVHRLRPRWLQVRGQRSFGQAALNTEVVVFQNQTMLGGVEVLREISPEMAMRIRYLDGTTATASLPGLGSRHVEGAIIIDTTVR
jgi:hypothetical protein